MDRQLLASIVAHLAAQRASVADGDSLDVAIMGLVEVFNITPEERAAAERGPDLVAAFRAAAAPAAPAAPATPAAVPASADPITESPLFLRFLETIKTRNFFEGTTPGTPEYAARMDKAMATFKARFSSSGGASASGEGTAAPAGAGAGAGAGASAGAGAPAPPSGGAGGGAEVDEGAAEALKAEGNAHLTKGRFEEAVDCYSAALRKSADPKHTCVYYCNRAAAKTSLKDFAGAAEDARASIAADGGYVKAHTRLGTALMMAEDFAAAVPAFERALELDGSNTTASDNLKLCRDRLAAASRAGASRSTAAAARPGGAPAGRGGGGPASPFGAGGLEGLMGNPMMAGLMSNPALMQMAQNVMSNPSMMQNLMGMMGGAGGGGGLGGLFGGGGGGGGGADGGDGGEEGGDGDGDYDGGGAPGGPLSGVTAALESDPALADLRGDPEVAAIIEEVRRDPSSVARHMGNPKMTRLMSAAMASLGGSGGGKR